MGIVDFELAKVTFVYLAYNLIFIIITNQGGHLLCLLGSHRIVEVCYCTLFFAEANGARPPFDGISLNH